jgi:hypothetical protein
MENVPDLPWGKIAAVGGALLTIHLTIRGASALVSMASQEARYRLASGHLPKRR